MSDPYQLRFDPHRNRLTITVRGFWTPTVVAAFTPVLSRLVDTLTDDFDTLLDSLDFPVQSNEVADLLGVLTMASITRTSGRVAVVVASMLNKLQVDRTIDHERLNVFMSVAQGEAWLDNPEAVAA